MREGSTNALLVAADLSDVTTNNLQTSDDFRLKGIAYISNINENDLFTDNNFSILPEDLTYP